MSQSRSRRLGLALSSLALAGVAVGCSNASDDSGSSATDSQAESFTFWDPYPQFDDSSEWVKLVQSCGEEAGVSVERTGYDTSDLTNKALLGAQQGSSADMIVIDNPVISTLAEAGVLTPAAELGLDTSAFEENLLGAGVVDGEPYGVPIGANTLALYYNADLLKKAGVDPESVTDWDSLNAALEKVNGAGGTGITFSAVGTEEGSFQFLPWFWGSGADLTELDSEDGVSAVQLWTDWLDKGQAPNSVINNTQTTAWQEFETGKFGFVENGTWQMGNAEGLKFDWGVISIPAKDGGGAPAPTGGEFVAAPVQEDTDRYETTTAIIDCLTNPENLLTTDTTLSYIAPVAEVQEQQVADNPALEPWVKAVGEAKGRTSDDLGTNYPIISEQMWGAFQNALSGSQSPEEAMTTAQEAAASKVE
jgi:multiple sugar transport system substrate-binding protein